MSDAKTDTERWKAAVEAAGGSVSDERLAIIQRFVEEERARCPAWALTRP